MMIWMADKWSDLHTGKDGKAVNCKCYDWCATCTGAECLEVQRVVDRLAAYEDAEEQGF